MPGNFASESFTVSVPIVVKYAYCLVNDLSNDYFIINLQFPTMLNFPRLLVFEIISCDLSDSSDWPIHSHEHIPCEHKLCSHCIAPQVVDLGFTVPLSVF